MFGYIEQEKIENKTLVVTIVKEEKYEIDGNKVLEYLKRFKNKSLTEMTLLDYINDNIDEIYLSDFDENINNFKVI